MSLRQHPSNSASTSSRSKKKCRCPQLDASSRSPTTRPRSSERGQTPTPSGVVIDRLAVGTRRAVRRVPRRSEVVPHPRHPRPARLRHQPKLKRLRVGEEPRPPRLLRKLLQERPLRGGRRRVHGRGVGVQMDAGLGLGLRQPLLTVISTARGGPIRPRRALCMLCVMVHFGAFIM